MFDDYDYKNTAERINVRFTQKHDEPMYPWEIAGFLSKLNTVYYKFELLNSISSAIKNGISPKEIFIFDNSLPLYQRYSAMNLLDEDSAAKRFYPIGLPFPLIPNLEFYNYNLLYQAFASVNSFLRAQHVSPLRTDAVASAYNVMHSAGLEAAEEYIVELASDRAARSVESARNRSMDKAPITEEAIVNSLAKYKKKKVQLISDLSFVSALDDTSREELLTKSDNQSRRARTILLAFFRYFDKTARPLVVARVGEGKFRVLGRSLINKNEQTGLELKGIHRNSPLSALIEGGIALLQTLKQEGRSEELHKIEVKKREVELEHAEEKLRGEKLRNVKLEIEIADAINQVTQGTDIEAIKGLPSSFIKERLQAAYGVERRGANRVLHQHGLMLDDESIKLIDIKV